MINLKIIKNAAFDGQASHPDAPPPGPGRGKKKGGIKGGGKPNKPGSPLLANLVSFWEMEETGNPRADAHGTNPITNGTYGSSASGRVGRCAYDATATNKLSIPAAAAGDFALSGGSFTIGAWVYSQYQPNSMGFVSYTASLSTAATFGWLLYKDNSSGKVRLGISDNGTISYAITSANHGGAAWIFYCAGYDAINELIWISKNGSASWNTTAHTMVAPNTTAYNLHFNSVNGSSTYWNPGGIDQVGYWNESLDSDAVTWLYNGGAGRSYADLSSYNP